MGQPSVGGGVDFSDCLLRIIDEVGMLQNILEELLLQIRRDLGARMPVVYRKQSNLVTIK